MSGTPVDALQRHLADTEAGPSDLRDLLVRHHTDTDAVEALCDHADGRFRCRPRCLPLTNKS